ncbi:MULTISPECIES: DUF1643 domain-containing protein [Cupriavidus]
MSGIQMGAEMSRCERYRYLLWRVWDDKLPVMGVIMVNPSTADHREDDQTIRKVIKIAKHNGFGGIHVGNLAAWRSSDPKALTTAADPVGPDNDRHLQSLIGRATLILCAWGRNARSLPGRVQTVEQMLRAAGVAPKMLRLTSDGYPSHPNALGRAYIPEDTPLLPYPMPETR